MPEYVLELYVARSDAAAMSSAARRARLAAEALTGEGTAVSEVLLQLVKSESDLDDGFTNGDVTDGSAGSDDEDEEGNGFVSNQPEKVVGSHHFDLLAQIEDELILSVPYVPKHDVCPGAQAKVSDVPQEEPAVKRPSPFAVLEQLKHKD